MMKCKVISDFNVQNLINILKKDFSLSGFQFDLCNFGEVMPVLLNKDENYWKLYEFVIIFTRPQGIISSFKKLMHFEDISLNLILKEVDEFCSHIINIKKHVKIIFINSWIINSYYRGLGINDLKKGGLANALLQMNLRLIENFENERNIFIIDTNRICNYLGKSSFNNKLWYYTKIPYSNEFFLDFIDEIKIINDSIKGKAKKLIVLDLDNTLWGGIIGDDGWQNLRLGGHDATGEAFVDFQKNLKSLKNRGILLAIVSKNEENIALEGIKNHPEMVLDIKDFVGWRINWEDKAKNIADLVSELNLGLQSVVFIDDNPYERERVKKTLTEILVPDWPKNPIEYTKALSELKHFDRISLSDEDKKRTEIYISEKDRNMLKTQIESIDEWLKTLDIKVHIEQLNEGNIRRTLQLLNKSNQMNLSTRRLTESELNNWMKSDTSKLWTFSVSDKFGNMGLTAIISLEIQDKVGKIVDFVISCRVLGRKIENLMLFHIIEYAKSKNLDKISAKYLKTAKNLPCLNFFNKSGFSIEESKIEFTWDVKKTYPKPDLTVIFLD